MTDTEKPPEGLATKICPRCGSGTIGGFGLMGGGYGPYVMCDGERDDASVGMECSWMYKEQSKDNEPPALDNR
jgi:hypothetical protein